MKHKEELRVAASFEALEQGRHGEPWFLATGCSWRRILQEYTDKPVIMPTNHPHDGHPDLAGGHDKLNRACDAVNACVGINGPLPIGIVKEMKQALEAAEAALVHTGDENNTVKERIGAVLAALHTGDISYVRSFHEEQSEQAGQEAQAGQSEPQS